MGKAKSLKLRVSSYFMNKALLGERTKMMVSQIDKIRITVVESELEALLLEAFYIKKYAPKYNVKLTDNKSYIRLRITIKDDYPKVLFARREEEDNSIYFGPYPSSGSLRLVLKTIRKVFPFQSVLNHPKRICLYNHLGLCPCPPVNDSSELRKEYRKNIKGIIRMLEGESQKIMKELEKQRNQFSKNEQYEDALKTQKKINALSVITTPFRQPSEYDVNPNLRIDIRQRELDELKNALNNVGAQNLVPLRRIECYDISNIQGTNATGSMVVFVNGEKESSQYRKFKVRMENKPNDFAMMKEVLRRRFLHDEWDMPDLVMVDGGKGQVSAALEVLGETNIPLIGLAKREETIIIPNANPRHSDHVQNLSNSIERKAILDPARMTNDLTFSEISLPKNSPALHLITRIRDEAHRFAITYHRHLRSKAATK